MNVTPASPGCLSGIRVLDLTQFEAGTTCTEALAWMGADIAKVEPPRGEAGRTGFGDAYYFMMYNANKRSLTVNLKDERGLALVKEMVKKADVFTENFAPGAVERLGLGYDVVSGINPSIIYAQVKGFGDGSPFEKGLSFRPDRAGRGWRDEHYRRKGRPPGQAGPDDRRHRHRHADGFQHRQRPVRPCRQRQGAPAAGGDAGFGHALQPRRVHHAGAHWQGGTAPANRQQPARRHLPLQARRLQRLRLPVDQSRQSGALAAPPKADRPR